MNYLQAFAISGSGMAVEKARVDVIAANIANAHSTHGPGGVQFKPLRLVSGTAAAADFATQLAGARVLELRAVETPPRLVFEPGHPDADANGFVGYPGINPVSEMVNLLAAVRVYEANVAALNAAKAMALRTLEIGG